MLRITRKSLGVSGSGFPVLNPGPLHDKPMYGKTGNFRKSSGLIGSFLLLMWTTNWLFGHGNVGLWKFAWSPPFGQGGIL